MKDDETMTIGFYFFRIARSEMSKIIFMITHGPKFDCRSYINQSYVETLNPLYSYS